MSLLIVNLCFAVVSLAVGFVAGAFLSCRRVVVDTSTTAPVGCGDDSVERQRALEKAEFASSRLRDLAHSMACDVGAHSSKVEEITANLQSLDVNDVAATGEGVLRAIEDIVVANSTLQERLEKAEKQIAAQADEIRAHETEARTDSLTELCNRRAFDDEMKRRIAEWNRIKTPFSLLILDIDHFKKFNDTHGHQAGDEVLRQTGKVLAQASRDMDIACRYGGEEFAIIMPATVARDGKNLVERVREMMESMSVSFEGKSLKVTASIGLAEVNASDDGSIMLKRADEALYAAKNAGRNCGHWHTGSEILPITTGIKRVAPTVVEAPPAETLFLDRLPNRTKFVEELRRRVAETSRSGAPICVIAMGVDSLAEVEKQHGSEGGQQLLDAVAEYLLDSLREMDLVAMAAADRFAIMLPNSTTEEAKMTIDRTLRALDGCELPLGDSTHRLSVRVGAVQNKAGDTAASLLERAEKQLQEQSKAEPAMCV